MKDDHQIPSHDLLTTTVNPVSLNHRGFSISPANLISAASPPDQSLTIPDRLDSAYLESNVTHGFSPNAQSEGGDEAAFAPLDGSAGVSSKILFSHPGRVTTGSTPDTILASAS